MFKYLSLYILVLLHMNRAQWMSLIHVCGGDEEYMPLDTLDIDFFLSLSAAYINQP